MCQTVATASEVASVAIVEDLYSDLLQPATNIDIIVDGTWMTWGGYYILGCIIERHAGLVIDHIVLQLLFGMCDQTKAL